MSTFCFAEYIQFLREHVNNLIEYRERTGTLEPVMVQIRDDLFDSDPFVVFGASVAATHMFTDKTLYH